MQAEAFGIIQIIRADPGLMTRTSTTISYMISTHADSDAFVLALAYAARNMSHEVVLCLDICITEVARYKDFCVWTHIRLIRERANFRAG